jgi:hypothetical protein
MSLAMMHAGNTSRRVIREHATLAWAATAATKIIKGEVQVMTATREGQGGKSSGGNGAAVRQPVGVGPEMAALGRFYRDVTWEGTIREGGMGPGAPPMTGVGRGTVQMIQDGRWIVPDCEQDQFLLDGTFVLTWQLHWVSGWAPEHGEYGAVMTDNYGHAEVFRGRIGGDRLEFESMEGAAARLASPGTSPTRPSSPGATKWRWVIGRGS